LSVRERQSIVSENDSTIDQLHNLSIQGETSQHISSEERRDHTDAGNSSGRQHPPPSADSSESNPVGATGGTRYFIRSFILFKSQIYHT
jgi:hypothetical protein